MRQAVFGSLICLVVLLLPVAAQVKRPVAPATPPATAAPPVSVPSATTPRKPLKNDDVYFTLARRVNQQNNAAVSGVVGELDNLLTVKVIAMGADGKALVTLQERAPSNASHTQKTIDVRLAPAPEEKWTWEEFQDGKRFYPVDRLFTYTQGELNKKKQMIAGKWANYAMSVNKQSEAGIKLAETAKAVLKADVSVMPTLQALRTGLAEALKNNDNDALIGVARDLASASETLTGLIDLHSELKANDAYSRLQDEFKATIAGTNAARRDYVEAVNVYNETLVRFPFALVAYGLEFQRIEPKLTID